MASDGFKSDFGRARRFLDEMKEVIGQNLIKESPFAEDVNHNTDLIVLLLGRQRIACRVRTHAYFDRHAGEFTIRSSRPSGAKTELEKIIQDKWCHYFLYAFSDSDDATLHAWTLANLEVFREWFLSFQGHVPGELRENHDGSSCFRAFRWASVFAKHPRTGAPFIIQSTLPPQLLPTEKFQAKPMRQPTLFGGLAS